jgi:hypothetical protein
MPLTNDSWHEERLLIDGALVDAEGGATYDNVNPANEEVIGRAADASKGDLEQAIAASRRAFDETEWSRDVGLRVRCLQQLHQSIPHLVTAPDGCAITRRDILRGIVHEYYRAA